MKFEAWDSARGNGVSRPTRAAKSKASPVAEKAAQTPLRRKCEAPILLVVSAQREMHIYEVRPRRDHRGVDLISDALPFGRLWYSEPDAITNAIGYTKFFSRSHDAVIRVFHEAGNVVATQEHAGDFKEP